MYLYLVKFWKEAEHLVVWESTVSSFEDRRIVRDSGTIIF